MFYSNRTALDYREENIKIGIWMRIRYDWMI